MKIKIINLRDSSFSFHDSTGMLPTVTGSVAPKQTREFGLILAQTVERVIPQLEREKSLGHIDFEVSSDEIDVAIKGAQIVRQIMGPKDSTTITAADSIIGVNRTPPGATQLTLWPDGHNVGKRIEIHDKGQVADTTPIVVVPGSNGLQTTVDLGKAGVVAGDVFIVTGDTATPSRNGNYPINRVVNTVAYFDTPVPGDLGKAGSVPWKITTAQGAARTSATGTVTTVSSTTIDGALKATLDVKGGRLDLTLWDDGSWTSIKVG